MLLPFALIVTGCSGSLKKGSVINEKFMKYNFGEEIEKVTTYQAPSKVELALGLEDGDVVFQHEYQDQELLRVTKTDGRKAWFSIIDNKYVIPFDSWEGMRVCNMDGGAGTTKGNHRVFCGLRAADEEGITHFDAFDEYGNKIYTGEYYSDSNWYLGEEEITRLNREENELYKYRFVAGGELRAVLYFNVDGAVKEVLTPEQELEKYPVVKHGTSLKAYGHENLYLTSTTGVAGAGTRYEVYDIKKEKFVSSFVIPSGANIKGNFYFGDCFYYQQWTAVHERENKYDVIVNDGEKDIKYNVETIRINYTNGKTSKVKTNLSFNGMSAPIPMYDKKGVIDIAFLKDVKEIRKDKSLDVARSILVDENLKELADVSGVPFTTDTLKPFGKELYVGSNRIVYDGKLKEVGYVGGTDADTHRIAQNVNPSRYYLVDSFGRSIYADSSITKITKTPVKDVFYVEMARKYQFVKITEEEKVEVIKEISKKDYTIASPLPSYRCGSLTTIVDTAESKTHYLDITTGAISDLITPEDGSTKLISTKPYRTVHGNTQEVEFEVYQRADNSCYSIQNGTSYALRFADFKK